MSTNTTAADNCTGPELDDDADTGSATAPHPFAEEIAEVAPYARRRAEGGR